MLQGFMWTLYGGGGPGCGGHVSLNKINTGRGITSGCKQLAGGQSLVRTVDQYISLQCSTSVCEQP